AIIADGEYYGMQTFDQHLAKLYERGAIDWAGALGVASNPHDLRIMLQQRGLATAGRPCGERHSGSGCGLRQHGAVRAVPAAGARWVPWVTAGATAEHHLLRGPGLATLPV